MRRLRCASAAPRRWPVAARGAALAACAAAGMLAACVVGTQPWVAPGVRLLYRAEGPGRAGVRFLVAREGNEIALTRGSGDASPTYDPRGGWVVFASEDAGAWDLWRVRLSGQDRTPLTRTPGINERFPAFASSGTLFFTSDSGGSEQVWRSDADGANAARVTSGEMEHSRPAPDSAGTRLAALQGPRGEGRLVWVEVASGAVTPVEGAQAPLGAPSVRRDGTVAYACTGGSAPDLCVVAPDQPPRRITDGPAADQDPVWSPDGSRIAFSSNRKDGNFDLWLVRADGSDAVRLTEERGADTQPAWVP